MSRIAFSSSNKVSTLEWGFRSSILACQPLTRHLTVQSTWLWALPVCLPYQVEDLHPGRPPLGSSTDLSRRTGCLV